eukprot:COSAG01_NODE_2704_length_7224_cov_114.816281_1_plen_360_part_10
MEAKISGERISSFLGEGRASDYRVVKTRAERRPANGAAVSSSDPDSAPAAEIAIEISEGTFRWDVPPPSILWTAEDKGQKFGSRANLKKLQERKAEMRALRSMTADQTTATPPVLQSINLTVNQGDLVFLLGQVGSGKTALLHTILGEMVLANGRVEVTGSLSYQAQSAFILNATVKENILFGSPYDADRYLSVVRGCALVPDLQTLPSGDTTEIGERGVNLSGGQKQRLGLARALYRQADIFLLDDPLSAVDAHVGRHIINYILEFMRTTGSTVVIACHQLHFLHHGDLIVLIRDANICECGTHDELMQAGGEFRQLMDTHAATSDAESTPGSTPRATTDSHEATSPAVSNAQVLDALV